MPLRAGQWPSVQSYPATVVGVLDVLGVLVRPPENEIPHGRPAYPQWHPVKIFLIFFKTPLRDAKRCGKMSPSLSKVEDSDGCPGLWLTDQGHNES